MISLQTAMDLALKKFSLTNAEIETISDIGHSWLFGFCDKKSKEPFDISPIAVNKESGTAVDYFPPDHIEEFLEAKKINIEEI